MVLPQGNALTQLLNPPSDDVIDSDTQFIPREQVLNILKSTTTDIWLQLEQSGYDSDSEENFQFVHSKNITNDVIVFMP